MIYPNPQVNQSLNLQDYSNRIIVAGTRGYNDRIKFHEVLVQFVNELTSPVLFISGAAPSGADSLIIQWCAKFKYPCLQKPADWNKGNGAGYIRNVEMSHLASGLIAFYDNKSPGTGHMIEIANRLNIPIKIIQI